MAYRRKPLLLKYGHHGETFPENLLQCKINTNPSGISPIFKTSAYLIATRNRVKDDTVYDVRIDSKWFTKKNEKYHAATVLSTSGLVHTLTVGLL
jgi:hypothetical protein